MNKTKTLFHKIDWPILLIPLLVVIILFILFISFPIHSKIILDFARNFIGNNLGLYYSVLGLACFIITIFIAFSKFGKIKLGNVEKPIYSSFKWGAMIFTSTMAADLLFYSFCEWALYANEPYIQQLGGIQQWASTYPLFHWGPIAWSFYIILAVVFGFMLHVRKRESQKFSEACRPVLGDKVNSFCGKLINIIAIIALLAGTATTFSLATPLITSALNYLFNIPYGTAITIMILLLIATVYTFAVTFGMKGISKLANNCYYLFITLLLYFLLLGGESIYILETGFSALGNMLQNFIGMATWIDPLRENSFPQNWTIYYWSYWMAWCAATPFFIGKISKGRTIKNVILGGYAWGLGGTFTSFIILGNYGLAQQLKHGIDISGSIMAGNDISSVIITIFETMPLATLGLILFVITIIAFYATTFDSLTMVVSSYSYKKLGIDKEPSKIIRVFWSIIFIILPIALIFANNSLSQLQSVSLIAAFPLGIIILLTIVSFFKDAKNYINEETKQNFKK